MTIYRLHEYGGEYEDRFDYIIGTFFSYDKAVEEKAKAEKEEKDKREHGERCRSCPCVNAWVDELLDKKINWEQIIEECKDHCNHCDFHCDENGDINCNNYLYHKDDSFFEIRETEVDTDGFVVLSAEAYNQLLAENKKLKEELEYAENHPPICIAPQVKKRKIMFNPFHFWTKKYEWDLLAPAREIVKDIKKMKKIKEQEKNKKTCHNYNCPCNKFSTCYAKECLGDFTQKKNRE